MYSLVEMREGRLPWSSDRDRNVIRNAKHAIADRTLFRELPEQFFQIWIYVKRLTYSSKVDYDFIVGELARALEQTEAANKPFDWESLSPEVVNECSSIPKLPVAAAYVKRLPKAEDYPLGNPHSVCSVM
jgi:hypothetical protein